MSVELTPGVPVNALALALDHELLPADEVVEGAPTTAAHTLDERDGRELGIWEMSPGTATDTEVDEIFVVLAGRATVTGIAAEPVDIGPGSIVRLTAGMQTSWTVHETLRKVYLV